MDEQLIELKVLCSHYNIDPGFVHGLCEIGLLEVAEKDDAIYLDVARIGDLERMMRLHYDLEINLAGIETIWYMLDRMHQLQLHINDLHNRLSFYESAYLRGKEE